MNRRTIAGIFGIVLVTWACSLIREETISSPASAAATPVSPGGIPFVAAPIQFVIPGNLATSAQADAMEAVGDQDGPAWQVAPPHLQVTLQGYPSDGSSHVPQIFVYPARAYAAANPAAAESIRRLQAVLSAGRGPYTLDQLPRIPFINAGQVLAAQQKVLPFEGGSGIRFVTQYAQDVSPINNGGLFYHYEGLTADGQQYLVAILPVHLAFLPADSNPDSPVPPGGVPFPGASAPGTDFENYFTQIGKQVNGAAPDQFNPALDMLDLLMRSIAVRNP